ncbi:MAG: NAD(P)-dependent alcohol dehydrogenase [Pseudomonadota bacterium]
MDLPSETNVASSIMERAFVKAAICTRYGPPGVVKIREVPRPQPREDEVLIRIHAACVNSGDVRIRAAKVPPGMGIMVRVGVGFLRPRKPILGIDLGGTVEAVGSKVTKFKPGDGVFAAPGFGSGTHAEYVAMPEAGVIAPKPQSLTMGESASLLFGGMTAVSFLKRDAKLQSGERVLINGASGAVGCSSIQFAKHLGAHVTAVCSMTNADLVRSLGADDVIDYAKEDFTTNGQTYDVIMDNIGNALWARSKNSLTENGRHLGVVSTLPGMIGAALKSNRNGKRVFAGIADASANTLAYLSSLVETGELKPVIDRTFAFDDIVDAHAYVDQGRKRGSVVIDFGVEI